VGKTVHPEPFDKLRTGGVERVLTLLEGEEPRSPEYESPRLRPSPDGSTPASPPLTMNGFGAVFTGLTLIITACPNAKPSSGSGDERLMAKLKAEKERELRDGPMVPPTAPVEPPKDEPVNPLAEFAAKGTKARELTLPAKTLLTVGKASLRLNGLEALHTVGEKISVTTDDWFVKVSFEATASEPTVLDLSAAHLELAGKPFAHARDAQAASHQKAQVTATQGGAPVVVYFEAPVDALSKGLTLVVPDAPNEARLELQ
jgi:hypothetical protein